MGVRSLLFFLCIMAEFSLRLLSSNVNSIKVRRTRHIVYDYLRDLGAEVIFLQETRLTTQGYIREAEREWTSGPSFWSLSVEPYAGVAILFNTKDVTVHRMTEVVMGRCLILEVTIHDRRLRLINIYGPQTVTERVQLFNEVKQYLFTSIPIIMAGDFNVTRTSGDRSSGRAVARDSRVLNNIILQAGLSDVFTQGGRKPKLTYSCSNRSSRIDMAFVSPSEMVGDRNEKTVPFSDHMALFFCLGTTKRPDIGRGLWKLNSSILEDVHVQRCIHSLIQNQLERVDFYDDMAAWWEDVKDEIRTLLKRLSFKKGKSKYGQYLKLRKELESLYSAGGDQQRIDRLKSEIRQYQYSRYTSLVLERDYGSLGSPDPFENCRERVTKKSVTGLTDPQGVLQESRGGILGVVRSYYADLFQRKVLDRDKMTQFLETTPLPDTNDLDFSPLTAELTVAEVKEAIDKLRVKKAPGPDGITAEFYKTFRDLLAPILVDVYTNCLESHLMPPSMRVSSLILLSKDMGVLWIVPYCLWGALFCGGLPGIAQEQNLQDCLPEYLKKLIPETVSVTERKFLTGFLQNDITDQPRDTQIILTAPLGPAKVTVHVNNNDLKKEVTVKKGQTVVVPITSKTELNGTTKYKHPVRIESDADITVMSRNYKGNSGDMALVYPVQQLGKEYYIITPPGGAKDQFKEFSVTSSDKATSIDIYLKGSVTMEGKKYSKGDKMTLNLMPYETYQIQSQDDLSGTRVVGHNKIAVIAGHTCAQNNIGCSHVYEQLKPTDTWGTSYFVPGMSFQSKYDTALVMASKKTSITYQSGAANVTKEVAAGELTQINLNVSSPLSIQSINAINVLLFGLGGTYGGKPFGSFLTNIQDIDSFCLSYNIIGGDKFDTNLGGIVAKTSSAPEIQLDGKSPNKLKWKKFPGSEYCWAEYNYGGGSSTHTIQHPTVPFGLLRIGYGLNKAYGSLAPCLKGTRNLLGKAGAMNGIAGGMTNGVNGNGGGLLQGALGWRRMTSKGTYFVTMFMQNTNSAESPLWEILVTGTSPSTSVTISINKSDFMKTVKVGKGETVKIEIPKPLEKKGTGLSPHGISIKANAEITVMTRNYKKTSGDVASIYPVDQWGVQYYIITPYNGPSNQYTEFGVLASNIPTSVTIVFSGTVQFNGKNYRKGDTLTVNLKPSQFLQVQSKDDLSGTMVTSQYPVAVLSGHTCAPSNGGDCGHVYEQLKTVENWGTSYFVPGLSFQSKYNQVYVMAPKATSIDYQSGGQKVKTNIEAGTVMRFNVSVSSPLSIHSTDRIQLLFYGNGGVFRGKTFGPFLTKIPDIDSFDLTYNLIGEDDFDNNIALMIAKTSSGPGITYNGNALQNAKWTKFPESEYSWAEYNYGGGSSSNRVQHPTTPFGLLSIGYSKNMAYGSVAPDIQAPGAPLPEPIEFLDDDKK